MGLPSDKGKGAFVENGRSLFLRVALVVTPHHVDTAQDERMERLLRESNLAVS